MTFVAARRGHRDGSCGTFFFVTFGTTHAPHDLIQPGVPPGKRRKRLRMATTDVAATALQINDVLSKLVFQFFDDEIAHD